MQKGVLSVKTRIQKHHEICKGLSELYIEKNTDYGNSFGETFQDLGVISAVTRIVDKVNRLKRLAKNESMVKGETIEDTLVDLANYSIMTLIEMDAAKEDQISLMFIVLN